MTWIYYNKIIFFLNQMFMLYLFNVLIAFKYNILVIDTSNSVPIVSIGINVFL